MAPEKEKITTMILYVDLKCTCCYKKVRKLLCKFPQIRDQVFDVDKNKVTITVVCCDPERIRDKLCCKGGRAIQSIEIVEDTPPPPKPKAPPTLPLPPTPNPKPKPVNQTSHVAVESPKTPPPKRDEPKSMSLCPPVSICCQECYEGQDGGPCHYVYVRLEPPPRDAYQYPPDKPPNPKPKPVDHTRHVAVESPKMPPPKRDEPKSMSFSPPVSICCQEWYEGRDGVPCHYGYGRLVPPPPCYDYYGYQYPPNRPCYVSRCDYFSEDNPQGCSIM